MRISFVLLLFSFASQLASAEELCRPRTDLPGKDYAKCQQGNPVNDSRLSNPDMLKAIKFLKEQLKGVVLISSAFRPPEAQKKLARSICGRSSCGGRKAVSKQSQHTEGIAADFVIPSLSVPARCSLMKRVRDYIGHGGAGAENGAAHFDLRDGKLDFGSCGPAGYRSNRVSAYRARRRR